MLCSRTLSASLSASFAACSCVISSSLACKQSSTRALLASFSSCMARISESAAEVEVVLAGLAVPRWGGAVAAAHSGGTSPAGQSGGSGAAADHSVASGAMCGTGRGP